MTPVNTNEATEAITQLLHAFNIPTTDHTTRTPQRVVKAWQYRLKGYLENPRNHLATQFTAPDNPGLIIARNIRIQTTCAHHLLPITGTATIAYRPQAGQKIVGLSKLARLAEGYAHRLQTQEQLTSQIVTALYEELHPMWAACEITATHGCMTLRGVRDTGTTTTTFRECGEPTGADMTLFTAGH